MIDPNIISAIVIATLFILLAIGVPIFASLGLAGTRRYSSDKRTGRVAGHSHGHVR